MAVHSRCQLHSVAVPAAGFPMRILHFFKSYLPDTTGGIEQVIFQLCEGSSNRVSNTVLTLSPNPEPALVRVASHSVVRARQDLFVASTGFSLQVFGVFREMASEADLVHFHFPWPAMDIVHFWARNSRPSVLSYHSDIVRQRGLLQVYRPLMHHFLRSMDRIIVASPNYLQSSNVLSGYSEKTVVIPYGLDPGAYPALESGRLEYWRQRVGEGFFLFVGVLRYYKGLRTLLEALPGTDFPLVIVGTGPEEGALKAQAERLSLKNVFFLGRLDDRDKVCLLHLSLAMVFPSHLRSEAFGVSLLEAAMYGKPMISCEIGTGTTYVNQHEVTGLAVPPNTPNALRGAMSRLWSDRDEASRFGRNAVERFNGLFTARQMCMQTEALYDEVLEENRRR